MRKIVAILLAVPALVGLDEIAAAARVLEGVAVRTPLLPADALTALITFLLEGEHGGGG